MVEENEPHTFDVRPDSVRIDAEATTEALWERRAELVEEVLREIPEEHRADWEQALDPKAPLTIYAIEDSQELAEMLSEIYAINHEIHRRSPR